MGRFASLYSEMAMSEGEWHVNPRKVVPIALFGLAWLLMGVCIRVSRATNGAKAGQPAPMASHPGSSSNIALAGTVLLVANPDSNSISLVSLGTLTTVTELSVGVDPRAVAVSPDGTTAYVANQGSDSLSVVDVVARRVTTELSIGDRPVGVAVSPDGRFVAVAELGEDRVRFLDATNLSTLSTVTVADRPHGLAFTPDSHRLLVTHLLSGDVTVLTVRPFALYLPLLLRSQPTLAATRNTFHETRNTFQVSSFRFRVTSSATIPTWPNVAPAPNVLINTAGTRAYLPQTMAHGLGLNTQFDNSVFPKVSVINIETEDHQTSEHISLPETDRPVGLPWDAALARGDEELWVVNAASNDLSVLDISDPSNPARVAHIPVGDNPRGIVISPDESTAYVNNTLAGTVSVIDTGAYTVTSVITVTDIPLPPALLHGKRLFHSSARPDLAQARWISCNTCHVEGEHDGRTWLLRYIDAVPPGATPTITRNTTSLAGMIETYPLRWSAEWDESADSEFSVRFEQFGTGLIHDGEMHPTQDPSRPNQGRSYDLDCLAAFIDSLAVPERSHTLTAAEQRGRATFESPETGCATCHPAPLYTDLQVHDVGTAGSYGEWFGPLIDTPTLRFLYDSAPYLHDGSATTLREVLTSANPQDEHGVTSHLTEEEIADLVAYLSALPYDEPTDARSTSAQ
jgi:YVTN family beta-propeller protein